MRWRICRHRSRFVCMVRKVIAMPSALPSRLKAALAARRACFRLGQVSFPSTAKMFSSALGRRAWEMRKVWCAHQFAGPAVWRRNSRTFQSITGSGSKKALIRRDWSHSGHRSQRVLTILRSLQFKLRWQSRRFLRVLKPGSCLPSPPQSFLFRICQDGFTGSRSCEGGLRS